MECLVADEELIVNYLTMVFGESRSRMYEVGGTQKQLDEYLLCPRRRHFRAKAYKTITLRVSTIFDNLEGNGVHLYFHSVDLPFHFAIHLGQRALATQECGVYPLAKPKPNADQEPPRDKPKLNAEEQWAKESSQSGYSNSFHFTFDNHLLKTYFQAETGRAWCLDNVLEWDRDGQGLCYKDGVLDIMENVYLCYFFDNMDFETVQETAPKLTQVRMVESLRKFTSEFLEIINGLAGISGDPYEVMLGGATFIPPHTRPIEFLYSRRSIGAVQFVKFNNESILPLLIPVGLP